MTNAGYIVIICLVVGFIVGSLISRIDANIYWKKAAIHHQAAHYNTTNAQFEWNK